MVTGTIPAVQALMDTEAERTFWEVVRHHERPPYFFDNEGVGNRLARAARIVTDGRLTPNSDGSYTVEGSEGRTYRITERCSCPNSQRGKSHWCYHHISVILYIEWQRRLRPVAPVVLGTLRAGTSPLPRDDDEALGNGYPVDDETLPLDDPCPVQALPLPPTTIDERLRQATARTLAAASQEDRMPQDEYIPEPDTDDAPVAVAEAPERDTTAASPRSLPGPVLLPSLDARTLEQSMQAWSAQRQVVKRFLQQELVEGTDYYTLRIKGRETKPALSKAGSEKFLALFQLHAVFEQDTATWTMLGSPQGTLCYRCQLHTRSGEIVGEGRGARTIQQDGGDINKAVKMGQKSACVDAILRTGALSDVFTQDLDEQPQPPAPSPTAPAKPSSQDLRQRIWALVKAAEPGLTNREAVEAYIKERTGMDLHPDFYQAIVNRLEQV